MVYIYRVCLLAIASQQRGAQGPDCRHLCSGPECFIWVYTTEREELTILSTADQHQPLHSYFLHHCF